MSIELNLLPLYCLHGDFAASFDTLRCPQDYALFAEIRALPRIPTPSHTLGFAARIAGELGFGRLTTDLDGAAFSMVSEEGLLACLQRHHPRHPVTAYLLARIELDDLPGFVILYWC